jgi:hypothetical protein
LVVLTAGMAATVTSTFMLLTPLQKTHLFDENWFIAGERWQHLSSRHFGKKYKSW